MTGSYWLRRSIGQAATCVVLAGLGLPVAARAQSPPASAPAPSTPPPAAAVPADSAILVGAGDIAKCDMLMGAVQTARLLDSIPGTVFTVGDMAYDDGKPEEFQKCYEPTWGRHKARTRPAPGNHDYHTKQGAAYYEYFGELAGPKGLGYYSYELAGWHILSLNSTASGTKGSAQGKWVQQELAAKKSDCILAYWHTPVFSSGSHGNSREMLDIWKLLYEAGAEIVLSGHDHDYERFAPQDPSGRGDPNGIRQFIVGTGGGGVYEFKRPAPNSEVRDNSSYGVLKLTLSPGQYSWEFVPVQGHQFKDAGSGTCTAWKGN